MDETVFEYRGKTFKAYPNHTGECSGCAFEDIECTARMIAKLIPECFSEARADGKQVMFKQVDNP